MTRLDVERVIALRPDLVLIWQRGNTSRELAQLEAAGLPVFRLEPQRLDDVVRAIERLGALLGHEDDARGGAGAARGFAPICAGALRSPAAPVRVFYQVWSNPLMTINRAQMVNDAIELCGGHNVFAALAPLVPLVSTEAVLETDPEAIFTADEPGRTDDAAARCREAPSFAAWQRHASLAGGEAESWMYTLNGDNISRQGPRIGDGAAAVCGALEEVRRERTRSSRDARRWSPAPKAARKAGAESHQRATAQTSHSGCRARQT